MQVEVTCARALLRVERSLTSLRAILERLRASPRGVTMALCMGVLRNYKLLEEALRCCGYRGEVRGSERGWMALVCAYELMYRKDVLTVDRVVRCSAIVGEGVAECLKKLSVEDITKGLKGSRALEVKYSIPRWVVEKLEEAKPPGGIEELLKAFQQPTPVWIRYNKSLLTAERALKELEKAGIEARPDPVLDDVVEVLKARPGSLNKLDRSKFYVQDRSSALAVHVLGPPGALLVDAFSAPGGKAGHAAWRWGPAIVALELSSERLESEVRLLRAQGVWNITFVCCDALRPPLRVVKASAIVDPDCSSMGRLGHSPETRLFLEVSGPKIIKRLQSMQVAALRRMAEVLPRGAVVVYSTCTLTLDENEHVVNKVVEEGLYEVEEASPWIGTRSPWLPKAQRVYPHISRCAGAFVARLVRV